MTEQEKKNLNDRYNDIFPTILRELIKKKGITQRDLAPILGIRPQTLSLYRNGETQPAPDTLVKIAKYFDVSVDYLLMGLSSDNKGVSDELGLTEESIEMLKCAKNNETFPGMPTVTDYINSFLSDPDFYNFLDDLSFKVNGVQSAHNITDEDRKKLPQINYEGYMIWDLQMFVQDFIHSQLVKRGLKIDKE